jgi:hypothetical protein
MRRNQSSSRRSVRARLAGAGLAFALLLAAAPLAAYVIYLKDGSSLQAREKYREQGGLALITLPSGAQTTLPLAQIDVARTEASNASDFGSATVLRGPASTPTPVITQRRPSLGELAAQRRLQPQPSPPSRSTTTAPAADRAPAPAVPEAPRGGLAKTSAGYVDFMRAPRTPVSRVDLATTVAEMLRSYGLANVGIYAGSTPRRLLLDVSTNSEGGVFQAVAASAQAMLTLESKQRGTIEALELFLATDNRQRAGQFLITPERAQELATKRLDLTAFYLKYVEF